MRIAVFGAGGRTGRQVVEQALERGHDVTAFVRPSSTVPLERDRLHFVEGDARDPAVVERALEGAEAVISVISLSAPDREPEHSAATGTIIEAAGRVGARRVVVAANNDVLTDRELTGEYAAMGREHRRNRDALQASGLDWTIGAAPWVTDDSPTGTYEAVVDARAPAKRLAATDFATFTIDALEHDEWIGQVVGVSAASAEH
jgi:putative NADH-flavin reductase